MSEFEASLARLETWLARHRLRAYEPYDALCSPLRPLFPGTLGRQVAIQIVRRSPFNLRPLLGIRPVTSAKSLGYFARAAFLRYETTAEGRHLDRGRRLLERLIDAASPGWSGPCWGNHFDYQSRVFYQPKGEPTVVWTALGGHALAHGYEVTGERRYLEAAAGACAFILRDLEWRDEGAGACVSYVPHTYAPIHNANMLAAGLLARVWRHTDDAELRRRAVLAAAYTAGCQRADGSWWYGEAGNLHWIDNWHTAYVLDALWRCIEDAGAEQFLPAFRRGVAFWARSFFRANGRPLFYAGRESIVDIQAAAQAIETMTLLGRAHDITHLERARRVARWTIRHMQDRDGHFWYQRGRRWINRAPMLHWGQGTMALALATLIHAERGGAVDAAAATRFPAQA